jgi:hypothetical protein
MMRQVNPRVQHYVNPFVHSVTAYRSGFSELRASGAAINVAFRRLTRTVKQSLYSHRVAHASAPETFVSYPGDEPGAPESCESADENENVAPEAASNAIKRPHPVYGAARFFDSNGWRARRSPISQIRKYPIIRAEYGEIVRGRVGSMLHIGEFDGSEMNHAGQ